jgi:hypothetical protein
VAYVIPTADRSKKSNFGVSEGVLMHLALLQSPRFSTIQVL